MPKKSTSGLTVRAYQGDAKTLLAFDLPRAATKNLAGFTIQCQPAGQQPYYIYNNLQFKDPAKHAQDPKEPRTSSINAPIHKFRWTHVPGTVHQGLKPFMGKYTYLVTPRYFDGKGSLLALDTTLTATLAVDVEPFETKKLALGFTRGYTQSQAFVRHFGLKALIRPKDSELLFDTSKQSGVAADGTKYTFQDQYEWLGFTARQRIFDLLNEVLNNKSLHLDMFAYDLNEPDGIGILLKLAAQGRIRMILDNAALHHTATSSKSKPASGKGKAKGPTPEDQFEKLFTKAAKKGAEIKRGKFKRYAHDKVMIVYDKSGAQKVLTGSTNFSVTGMYVNSNHVLIYDDRKVAGTYAKVFTESWGDNVSGPKFAKSSLSSSKPITFTSPVPKTGITFSPHTPDDAKAVLDAVAKRIAQEAKKGKGTGSVLFAVMQIDKGQSPVYTALNTLHANQKVFSYGISDSPKGIALYKPGKKTGVLVTGKPISTQLPPPFNQVPNIGGVGHQVHHKFVVCGFNTDDAVVYCGSSNLAEGGEECNGDNLLAVYDRNVATAFAIEALQLVDHFNFLDGCSKGKAATKAPPALKAPAAAAAGWFLSTDDKWVAPYYDPNDLHCVDRQLFA